MYDDLKGEVIIATKDIWGNNSPIESYVKTLKGVDTSGCSIIGIEVGYTSNKFSVHNIIVQDSEGNEKKIPFTTKTDDFFQDFVKQAEIIIRNRK